MGSEEQGLSQDRAFALFIHQNGLMWSRTQTMQAVQLAGLAGAYGVRTKPLLALAILLLTVLLTLLVFGLLRRDMLLRHHFESYVPGLRWDIPRRWYAPLKGSETTWAFLLILLALDGVMGAAVLNCWL
jgi:hypothetical protein